MRVHGSLPPAYSPEDQVWLCLTTLHHRRFVEDAIHLASLPAGGRIRLRYRKKYVSRDVWDRTTQDGAVGDVRVLVALAATDAEPRNVVRAIRQGRIVSARCEGAILVVDVSLEAFLSELGENSFWDELSSHQLDHPSSFGPTPQDGIYLQRLSYFPATVSGDRSIQAWERCTEGFFVVAEAEARGSSSLRDALSADESVRTPIGCVPFLYHLSVPKQGFSWKILESGGFSVEAGATIAIEVHTTTAPHLTVFHNAAGEIYMDLSNSAAAFTSSRRVRIDSRRDVREVRIATSALFRRSHGHLSVRTVVFVNEDSAYADGRAVCSAERRDEVVIARHDFPLVVGNLMPVLASLFVAAAAGVAVFKLPETSDAVTIRHFFIPIAVSALAFLGLMLGLRKDAKG